MLEKIRHLSNNDDTYGENTKLLRNNCILDTLYYIDDKRKEQGEINTFE